MLSPRSALDKIGLKLGVKKAEDWYRVKHEDIVHHGGSSILRRYGSKKRALCSAYPELDPSKFVVWTMEKQREFMESIGRSQHVTKLQDWYKVTEKGILHHSWSAHVIRDQGKWRHIFINQVSLEILL